MKKLLVMLVLCVAFITSAQYTSPNIDGTIVAGEYGVHTDGQNQQTNTITWYMTWDVDYLYIGIGATSNNTSEAALIYIDYNPISVVNGGDNNNGSVAGFNNYDRCTYNPPFRADFVLFFKNGYHEYRTASEGSWSSNTSNTLTYAQSGAGGNNSSEIRVPWSAITGGGIPSSFNWFGCKVYGEFNAEVNGIYGAIPIGNPNGTKNQAAYTVNAVRYYTVSSTSNGSATKPFMQSSYTNDNSDIPAFGGISVYDFTMNSAGKTITRSAGDWIIAGNLIVNDGTVSFGSTTSSASVAKDVLIGNNGTLSLSSLEPGDIYVGGNWTNNGTFNCNGRAVFYNGSSNQTVGGTVLNAIDYLIINNSQGVTLSNHLRVNNLARFSNGVISLGDFNTTLSGSATVDASPGSLDATKMFVATGNGELRKEFSGTGSFLFPVGDNTGTAEYSPVTVDFSSGTFTSAYVGVNLKNSKHPSNGSSSNFINRYWSINSSGISGFSSNLSFVYADGDIAGDEANLYLGQYASGTWNLLNAVNAATNTLSGTVSSFSDFTGGEQNALPVELSSFSAALSGKSVVLNWRTETEVNNYGFDVERSADKNSWNTVGFVSGNGNSNSPKQYSFADNSVSGAGKYYYRLKQMDNDGTTEYSKVLEIAFDQPMEYALGQNYPNPFNPTTAITFSVPEAGFVNLSVFDLLGQKVAELVNGNINAGAYTMDFDATNLQSGIYFYTMKAGSFTETRKMMLTK